MQLRFQWSSQVRAMAVELQQLSRIAVGTCSNGQGIINTMNVLPPRRGRSSVLYLTLSRQ